ncbi:hypothetical protein TcasGA2_TC005878 [Tribolium castaneum]|uniref:Uncharacterized protein n=1 Tax=Tribolium castaneum TaxID=7070 RepID=D6WVS9_TRICA|nr:hypothetical protein TcasGA2_TC005878 [Tribolium castaneum]
MHFFPYTYASSCGVLLEVRLQSHFILISVINEEFAVGAHFAERLMDLLVVISFAAGL